MDLFCSPRERRLWLTAVVVLLAIYSTLGVVRPITEALRERGWLIPSLALLGLALLAALGRWAWRHRPGWREVAVGIAVVLAYVLLILWMRTPEEVMHLVQYGLVGGLFYLALEERDRCRRQPVEDLAPAAESGRMGAVVAVLLTAGAGWLDEGIQYFLPSRYYDLRDVAFNALAGLLAVTALSVRGWARRRDEAGGSEDAS